VVGVIYDPHRDEVFSTVLGHAAYMNEKWIHVGSQEMIGDAIAAMGLPPPEESIEMRLCGLQALRACLF
jgi:myo-inositol-1(or 4)-monophosphatase